jgi:hypothetical protein
MPTLNELKESLIEELEDKRTEILSSRYPEDLVCEMIDGWVPIYNHELVECLSDDISLAYVEDSGLLPECSDVFQIISIAIYEQLSQFAGEWLSDEQEKPLMDELLEVKESL